MNTKYDIGDKVLIEVTVKAIRVYENGGIEYVVVGDEFGTSAIEEKNIHGLSEAKETSFTDYLNEQLEDPEFKKEYDKVIENECNNTNEEYKKKIKEFEKKIIISVGFRNAIRDAIYGLGDVACNVSKTLGLPANCLTNIILGHTKKISYERFRWICTALNITEYTEEHI